MSSHPDKILIACEQGHCTGDAQLGEQSVDRPNLQSGAAAIVPQLSRFDVILALGKQARQGRKTLEDLAPRFRPCKPLQQLLQH